MQLLTQSGSSVRGYGMHFKVKSTLELEGVNTKGPSIRDRVHRNENFVEIIPV